jgi:hypothetical protein
VEEGVPAWDPTRGNLCSQGEQRSPLLQTSFRETPGRNEPLISSDSLESFSVLIINVRDLLFCMVLKITFGLMMAVGLCFLLFSFNDAEIKPKPVSVSLKLSILSKNLYSLCSEIFWKRKCLGNAQVKVLFQKEVQFTQRSFGKCLSSFSFENIYFG